MSATADHPDRMFLLQKMRITTVIRLTQENAMVLTFRQRVAGKEIEVMAAERDAGTIKALTREEMIQLLSESEQTQEQLAHQERTVLDMEQTLKQIDGDIAAMCQS